MFQERRESQKRSRSENNFDKTSMRKEKLKISYNEGSQLIEIWMLTKYPFCVKYI